MTKEEILQFLKMHHQELRERFGVQRVGLFGSFAREEASDDSDIDIIVELEKKDFFIRSELREYLQDAFHREVDIGYFESLRQFVRESATRDLVYVEA